LQQWFAVDLNAMPPSHVLKPIAQELPDYQLATDAQLRQQAQATWWTMFTAMSEGLRKAALLLQKADAQFDAAPFVMSGQLLSRNNCALLQLTRCLSDGR
jgi:hypothetical protein